MTLERVLAWAAAILVVAATVLIGMAPPRPSEPTVLAALAVVVALPLAVVLLGWLYSLRSRAAGRVGARFRSLR